MKYFIDAAESQVLREEHHKWDLGIGIGVGLGVPILMALASFVTWSFTKKGVVRVEGETK